MSLLWPKATPTVAAAVGVDRQRANSQDEPGAIGGICTFTLLGTVAGTCGFLIVHQSIALGVVILASAAVVVMLVRLGAGRISRDATTEVATLAVLASGVTAGIGHLSIAAALYAWTVLLLVEKSGLHALVDRIGVVELEAAAQFAAMALIVLPLLPSGNYGPRGVLNLRSVWILVLVFSGISFAGYLARKAMGTKIGWVLTGLLGGLISSTQVALSFSRDSRSRPESHLPLFGGVMAATAVSMLRVCVLCLLLRPALATATLISITPPFLVAVFFALSSLRRPSNESASFKESNPLRVFAAIYLALSFVAAQYLTTFARAWFGNAGLISSATLLGSFDIDALVASLAPMVRQGMLTAAAARVLTFGILGNTVVKFAAPLIWGRGVFRRNAALDFVCVLAGLALSLFFMH
jgi:uncharacterized membrane protein (DUF4010 family)